MNDTRPFASQDASARLPRGPHVLIIGGGASGVMMAAHMLSRPDAGFRVTIVEGRHMLGCGIAYSTTDPDHLLNTRAQNMSAFPEPPHHFLDWLHDRPEGVGVTDQCFVSRATYGAYMAGLLAPGRVMRRTVACAASARPACACAKRQGAWPRRWTMVRC